MKSILIMVIYTANCKYRIFFFITYNDIPKLKFIFNTLSLQFDQFFG